MNHYTDFAAIQTAILTTAPEYPTQEWVNQLAGLVDVQDEGIVEGGKLEEIVAAYMHESDYDEDAREELQEYLCEAYDTAVEELEGFDPAEHEHEAT